MKIRRVGAELLHADRRKERRIDRHDKANNRFRNLEQRLKITCHRMVKRIHRVTEVCERSIRIKENEVWENRKDGFRS